MTLCIGLMSGTSMDGMDAVIMDVDTHQVIHGITQSYSEQVYRQAHALIQNPTAALADIWQLHTQIGKEFAGVVLNLLKTARIKKSAITAIGSHGQTIRHDPLAVIPYTVQLGCPHTIAEMTGIQVVADFRTRDMVVGGQGAPFAPLYHEVVLSHPDQTTAVVNVGGISNITFLSAQKATYGYDVGPGNCLMDAWIQKQLGRKYDHNGAFASQGEVLPELLTRLLADPYFSSSFPKSVCKTYFSLTWLECKLRPDYQPADVQATLVALSARAIVNEIEKSDCAVDRLILCGGGAHNLVLLKSLQALLPQTHVANSQQFGVNPDFFEAMMFAWLAQQTLTRTHLNLRHITGAKKPVILGAIYSI